MKKVYLITGKDYLNNSWVCSVFKKEKDAIKRRKYTIKKTKEISAAFDALEKKKIFDNNYEIECDRLRKEWDEIEPNCDVLAEYIIVKIKVE